LVAIKVTVAVIIAIIAISALDRMWSGAHWLFGVQGARM